MGPHGGPQNTVTPIPLSPKPKHPSQINKPTFRDVSKRDGSKKSKQSEAVAKASNSSSKPSIRTPRVTQINFEEFLEGSLRLNGAAKYLGLSSLTGRWSRRWSLGVVGRFFGVAVSVRSCFFFGGEPGVDRNVETKLV